jgi:hypothetical protein
MFEEGNPETPGVRSHSPYSNAQLQHGNLTGRVIQAAIIVHRSQPPLGIVSAEVVGDPLTQIPRIHL